MEETKDLARPRPSSGFPGSLAVPQPQSGYIVCCHTLVRRRKYYSDRVYRVAAAVWLVFAATLMHYLQHVAGARPEKTFDRPESTSATAEMCFF